MEVLLVQCGFLGDAILSTAVPQNIRTIYPDARITVLTTPQARSVFEHHADVAEVLVFDKRASDAGISGLFRVSAELKRRKFALALSLHKSYRTAVLLRMSGIPIRYGFREASAAFLYSKTVPRRDQSHDVLRNLAILRTLGLEPEEANSQLSLGLPDFAHAYAKQLRPRYEGKESIVLAPGSVWATKRWKAEGFAEVAKGLFDDGFAVVLVGGPDEVELAAKIENDSGVPLINLVGKSKLLESAAVIGDASLLVTNDSSPLHMASALGTPIVALFCATVPEFGYGPWGVPFENLGVKGLPCRPCGRHGGMTCPTGTLACIKQLSSESVLKAVSRVLDKKALLDSASSIEERSSHDAAKQH